jgi:hypothetical protein
VIKQVSPPGRHLIQTIKEHSARITVADPSLKLIGQGR